MPEVIQRIDAGISENLLDQYISDILLKDVVQRHEIRNTRLLRQLATFYYTNISSLHSYSSLAKAFSAGTDTVMLYTQAMQEAFLLFEVERYHPNLKSQARDPRKLYAIDLGLRRAIARSPQVDSGKALENVVYLELRRRGLEVMYYKGNQEVDFLVLDRYQPIEAIQVCASLSGAPDTRRREVQALTECMKALNLSRGTIIALNEDETIKVEGLTISVVSAWRWLWEGGIQGEARQFLG
jgi:predicted AAA+ superfamily ATPase